MQLPHVASEFAAQALGSAGRVGHCHEPHVPHGPAGGRAVHGGSLCGQLGRAELVPVPGTKLERVGTPQMKVPMVQPLDVVCDALG